VVELERVRKLLRDFFQEAYRTHTDGRVACSVPWSSSKYQENGIKRSGANKLRAFFLDGVAYNFPLWYDDGTRDWHIDLEYWPTVESVLWWINNYDFVRLYE